MFLIRFSLKKPLIVNLFVLLVALVGVLSWYSMPQEMFPEIELDKVRINTVFAGASPLEVERQVTLPIEVEFDGLADIDVITSTSSEGLSNVLIKLKPGTDVDDFVRDAAGILDRVSDLPDAAQNPELKRIKTRFPVVSVALFGELSRTHLFEIAETVQRGLLEIPGVASAGMSGRRDWEIWIVIDPDVLSVYGISQSEIIQALRDNLQDLPGGRIESSEGDIMLRGVGVKPEIDKIKQLILRSNEIGGGLLLGEVATVHKRLEFAKTLARFNGSPSVNMMVTKTANSSTIDISKHVHDYVDQINNTLPPTVKVGVFSDLSVYVKTRLETVKSSGLVGLILVLLSLYLFLNFRVALITALGIPVSFLFATMLMNYFGQSINMVSLFAFLVVLGMIVDDAIIVTENIYRHMEAGLEAKVAAIKGAKEVFWPVVASTMTTIAAFLPMFAIGGTMGAFIMVIPIVVIFALLGSLLEAFGVLPTHAAQLLVVSPAKEKTRIDWASWLNKYTQVVRWVLLNRYFALLAIVGILVLTLSFAATRMSFQLFGQVDSGQFFVNIEAPNTYSLNDSTVLAKEVEKVVLNTLNEKELQSLLTNVGVTFVDFNTVLFDSNYIQLIIDLKKPVASGFIENWITPLVSLRFDVSGSRERSTSVIIDELRESISGLPGVQRLSILKPAGGPAGADIEVGIRGEDVGVLRSVAQDIKGYLKQLPGVHDVRQDLELGKQEFRYSLNDRGRELGLTQEMLSTAVRVGFQGLEVVQVTQGNQRLPVRLIYTQALRTDASLFKNLKIVLPGGQSLYLADVADIKTGRGFNIIKRRDLKRLATVTAEVDPQITTAIQVADRVKEKFDLGLDDDSKREVGKDAKYELLLLGEKREATESMTDMASAFVIALALIFIILAALFNSLLDPFVVMVAIPFGLIGIIFGHFLMGFHIQFLSMVGFLALAGIIVNDSLILVDFAKRLRAEGWDRVDAMVEAGRVRARPILLTTVTTFLGISPLIFFSTGQTAFLAPMAVSLGFGLIFATVLILIGIPCFYLAADDFRRFSKSQVRRVFQGANKFSKNG